MESESKDVLKNYQANESDSEAYECAICFTIMVEPIKISCNHVFCLSCIEKLLLDNTFKCPMDRKEFNPDTDLEFFKDIFNKNKENFPLEMIQKAEKLIQDRNEGMGMVEITLVYGNFHQLINSVNNSNSNKHKWKVFVTCKKSVEKITLVREKLRNQINLFEIVNRIEPEKKNIDNNFDLEFEDRDIIKTVVFKLHPTFNPSSVKLTEGPFEVSRIGWGVFNIQIQIEFKDYLNIPKLEVDHYLNFSGSVKSSHKSIYVDIKKLKEQKEKSFWIQY